MTTKKERPLSSIQLPDGRAGRTVPAPGAASRIWNRNISQSDELAQRLGGFATRETSYDPSTSGRRVPYGRHYERHFPDRGRSFHPDWNDLKGACSRQRAADANGLARISHRVKRIGAPNQRKLFCENDFLMIRGAPRCRQSVSRIFLDLKPSKAARWSRRLTVARLRRMRARCCLVQRTGRSGWWIGWHHALSIGDPRPMSSIRLQRSSGSG